MDKLIKVKITVVSNNNFGSHTTFVYKSDLNSMRSGKIFLLETKDKGKVTLFPINSIIAIDILE